VVVGGFSSISRASAAPSARSSTWPKAFSRIRPARSIATAHVAAEGADDPLRLREAVAHTPRAQHLERLDHHDTATQIIQ